MRPLKNIIHFVILIIYSSDGFGQCANPSSIYTFTHDEHTYEVVKENKSWTDAAACAVSRNGYLAEINNEAEQNEIFNELVNNAGIIISNTQNQFGTASIWLGGSDAVAEGNWIWDGDNDGNGPQFWSGGPGGTPVDGLYTNWGISPAEPDNSGGQDHLTIIIKPTAVNFGLWNDLISTNSLYYLIEYDIILSTQDLELKSNVKVYPNPFKNVISIENNNSIAIDEIHVFSLTGQKIKTIDPDEIINNEINLSRLDNGMYILNIHFENGELINLKIVK